MRNYFRLLIPALLLCLSAGSIRAQAPDSPYRGGIADGHSQFFSGSNFVSSISFGPFLGSSGSGYASFFSGTVFPLSASFTPYFGGIGSGYKSLFLGTEFGDPIAFRPFSGGIGDGFSSSFLQNFPPDLSPAVFAVYNGGIGDGWSSAKSESFCSNLGATPGVRCNDGNPCTINDVVTSGCNCVGMPVVCGAALALQGRSVLCPDEKTRLLASPVQAGYFYRWLRNGQLLALTDSVNLTISQAGSYQVIVSDGISADTSDPLSIQNAIIPNFSISGSPAGTLCPGTRVTLSGNLTGNYRWNNGVIAGTLILNTAGSYSATYTTANNCAVQSNSVTVAYHQDSINFTASRNDLFLDSSASTSFSISGSVVPASINWNFGDGGTATSAAPAHTYSQIGFYPVTLNVTDTRGCQYQVAKSNYIAVWNVFATSNVSLPQNYDVSGAFWDSPLVGYVTVNDSVANGLFYTSNGGQTWTRVNTGTMGRIRGIRRINNIYWIFGRQGLLYYSLDGLTWYPCVCVPDNQPGVPPDFTNITPPPVGIPGSPGAPTYLGGDSGDVWVNDGGPTWNPIPNNPFPRTTSIRHYYGGNGWGYAFGYGGGYGRIYELRNTGWAEVSGAWPLLYGGLVVDQSTAFAVGANGTIIGTVNGGLSWNTLTTGLVPYAIRTINRYGNRLIAAGDHGTILISDNGGIDWEPYNSGYTEDISSITIVDCRMYFTAANGGIYSSIIDFTPEPPVIAAYPDTLVCKGDSIGLRILNYRPDYVYSWSEGSGGIGRIAVTINVDKTCTYSVISSGACGEALSNPINLIFKHVVPVFNGMAPVCRGDSFSLPDTSLNGVSGHWSPAFNFQETTEYTFTPDPGQCAETVRKTVTIQPWKTAEFTALPPLCKGSPFPGISGTSNNGVNGFWTPADFNTDSAGIFTLNFTAYEGQCAYGTSMQVEVKTGIPVEFSPVGPLCQNSGTFHLPSVSVNGFSGSWYPSAQIPTNNSGLYTRTFIPVNEGVCGEPATIRVRVNRTYSSNFSRSACGQFVLPWGQVADSSGIYSYTYQAVNGCDSLVNLQITITNNSASTDTVSACGSYQLPWGQIVSNSGLYSHNYVLPGGCNQLVSYLLTILPADTNYVSATACGSYALPWDSTTSSSGVFRHVYVNSSGCDSLVIYTISITQPQEPENLACWQTAVFNATACQWDVTGTQPSEPSGLACWQSANFNTTTCQWDVTGSQPAQPTGLACWQSASFNTSTCSWDVTGTQPAQPTGLACWQSVSFNTTTCQWDVTGTQPVKPTAQNCWDNFVFNTGSCSWVNTGSPAPLQTTTAEACGSYVWAVNNQTYTQGGTYNFIANCQDYRLVLTLTPAQGDTTRVTACGPYQWNGFTYTQSGTYTIAATCCKFSVLNFWQGPTRTGGQVPLIRSVASNALVPQKSDVNNGTINFFSLGYRGQLTLMSGCAVKNGPGNDLKLWETTWSSTGYPSGERARLFASQDGVSYVDLGLAVYDKEFDLGSLAWAKYFRIVDETPYENSDDAYDVDGIEVLNGYENVQCCRTSTLVLTITTSPVTAGSISGPANSCAFTGPSGSLAAYSIAATNATGFNWTIPAGATSISGQGTSSISFRFPAGFTSGTVTVSVSGCSGPLLRSLSVRRLLVTTPGSISGPARACPGNVNTYSVSAVANTTSYQWTIPAGTTIVSGAGSNSISLSFGSGFTATGTLSVIAVNSCGSSGARSLSISRNVPATPSVISGQASGICGLASITYSVTAVAGITYNWTVPSNVSILSGQGTNSLSVRINSGFSSGNITVKASNGCGTSAARSLSISALAAAPASISGPTAITAGSVQTYSVAAVSGAVSYNWTVPSGWTIQSGQGSNSITVKAGTNNGSISVRSVNSCGTGTSRSLAVSVGIAARQAVSTGETEIVQDITLKAYPNPFCDAGIHVEISGMEERLMVVEILDVHGREVYREEFKTDREIHLQPSGLPAGVYTLKVSDAQGVLKVFRIQRAQ